MQTFKNQQRIHFHCFQLIYIMHYALYTVESRKCKIQKKPEKQPTPQLPQALIKKMQKPQCSCLLLYLRKTQHSTFKCLIMAPYINTFSVFFFINTNTLTHFVFYIIFPILIMKDTHHSNF